jgi:DNA polymerase I-like protein with 3'-5' exonuclease and polymerase domains
MLAIDTETTGVDKHHGAMPFFITTCDETGTQKYWEWEVDPITRQPIIHEGDVDELEEYLNPLNSEVAVLPYVFHNAKFDVAMLGQIRREFADDWLWDSTVDTLLAAHLLYSNRPKNLTDLGIQILGVDIEHYELALKDACIEARRITKSKFPTWRIAKAGEEDMPSAKDKAWKFDTWLPRKLAIELDYPADHPWYNILREYANADSALTLALWKEMEGLIKERQLEKLLAVRFKLLPIIFDMERRGITLSRDRYEELVGQYTDESEKAGRLCTNIAKSYNYDLQLPKSGNNKSLLEFCFGSAKVSCPKCLVSQKLDIERAENLKARIGGQLKCCTKCGLNTHPEFEINRWLDVPVVGETDTGNPSLDKMAMEAYQTILPEKSKQRLFMRNLRNKRKRDTALSYMESYVKFWKPLREDVAEDLFQHWYRLFPSLNPTGTDTLRFSSSNPNEQNISKQEGFNLRYMFGPAPEREWWSCDAKNIELRLPAYESGEQELIDLFERPDEPPYYGSTHLLNFHTVYPDIWNQELVNVGLDKVGPTCKKKYASSYYQWCKNGGFAVQYGAIDRADGKGTADIAFHRAGSHSKLKARFARLEKLNQRCISQAEKCGYVETIPDKTVDSKRGYPLLCTRTEYGKILPTVPLNYHIQGSAMWWMIKAMIRVQQQLDEWKLEDGFDGFITMQVHDELVFDFPKSRLHPSKDVGKKFRLTNLWRIRKIQSLMEQSGDDYGIPTPTSCEYHEHNWSEGVSL